MRLHFDFRSGRSVEANGGNRMQHNNNEMKLDLVSFLETDHKKLLRPNEVSKILGISTETVYDWKYRSKKRGIPEGLFVKISSMLFVRSDLLKQWISGRIG